MATHITSVLERKTVKGELWRIRDDQGGRYSTENMWLAGICERARQLRCPVVITSSAGWYDRTIRHVELLEVAS